MFKKKQVLAMVGIAIVSFVIGSMFNVMANDGGGSPWDKIWTNMSELQSRVETLENQSLPQGFINAPAYDSGWISISHGRTTLTHNLNTTNVLIYLIGNSSLSIRQFHQISVGGDNMVSGEYHGVCWLKLTETTIDINRFQEDTNWPKARIMIWKISEP